MIHDMDLKNARLVDLPDLQAGQAAMIVRILKVQDEKLALCNELEQIADSLPASVDRQKCIYAAQALCPLIRRAHRDEETLLFPQLARLQPGIGPLSATLDRLKYEHFEDECYAEELTEALFRLGADEPVNDEAIGYMLRGFFEGLRRHIAFEKAHLLEDPQIFNAAATDW
ncbi:hypothetical protein NCHU2750_16040 [Neorhizobium sp. NCHU2750]|nr:hypothetical protein NCHU2750_16040 [Neorhizobium sp. NCHU2750]